MLEETPYNKDEFSNRILYSDISVNDAYKNGFRVFKSTNFKDYPKTYGSITKLVELGGNLICVFEHGVALIPINERAVAAQGDGGYAGKEEDPEPAVRGPDHLSPGAEECAGQVQARGTERSCGAGCSAGSCRPSGRYRQNPGAGIRHRAGDPGHGGSSQRGALPGMCGSGRGCDLQPGSRKSIRNKIPLNLVFGGFFYTFVEKGRAVANRVIAEVRRCTPPRG